MYVIDAWYSREAKHQYLSTFLSPLIHSCRNQNVINHYITHVCFRPHPELGSVIGAGPYLPTCPEYLTALFYIVA